MIDSKNTFISFAILKNRLKHLFNLAFFENIEYDRF